MIKKRLLLLFLFLNLFSIVNYAQRKEIRVLFVGNSLTYTNDLPSLVAELAALDSVKLIHKSFTFPDYSLEDHWNEGRVEDEIEKGNYDYVVLQQGPSALDESRVLLIEYVKKLADVCKKANAQPVLFMVWPSKTRLFDLDRVIKNYSDAAKQTASILCAAGLAWKYAWKEDPGLELYSFDGFHPSLAGSLLSALTIYAGLSNLINLKTIPIRVLSAAREIPKSILEILKNATMKAIGN